LTDGPAEALDALVDAALLGVNNEGQYFIHPMICDYGQFCLGVTHRSEVQHKQRRCGLRRRRSVAK
jgi:hypothetical protein